MCVALKALELQQRRSQEKKGNVKISSRLSGLTNVKRWTITIV